MTLNKYIEDLQMLQEKYGDKLVIYSKDDEGNEYQTVNWCGTRCHIYEDLEDFYRTDHVASGEDLEEEGLEVNAIIIN